MNAPHFRERQEKFTFIKQHKMKFPVKNICKVLQLSKSGYHNWLKQGLSKRCLHNQKLQY